MKGILFLIAILFYFQTAQCQEPDSSRNTSNQELYDYFITKHKKQKKTGLILLGSGLAATGVGIIIMNSNGFDDAGLGGFWLFTAGSLTTISSIPVLIISGSNKRKAETYVQLGQYRQIDFTMPDSKVVSVGVKIEF